MRSILNNKTDPNGFGIFFFIVLSLPVNYL